MRIQNLMSAATLVASVATAASAGNPNYGVSTIAGIFQYGGAGQDSDRAYNPQYFYNVVGGQYPKGYPGGPYAPGDTGVYSHSGANFSGLVSSGTSDTAGNRASASDTISGVDSNGGPAAAYAGADLANASLHASASGTYEGVYQGEDYYSGAGSQAGFYDTLTFNVAGAAASTVTDITMTFNLDGSATTTRTTIYGSQAMHLSYSLSLGDTNFNQGAAWDPQNGTGTAGSSPVYVYPVSINSGSGDLTLLSVSQLADSPGDTQLQATYQLTGASVTAGIYDGLSLACLDGVSCDWSNTSSIQFQLPQDVTLSSASGVFPSGAAGAPEPGTWTMMLVGAAGAGAAMRRRRRVPARLAQA